MKNTIIIIVITIIISIYVFNYLNFKKFNLNYEILQKNKPNRNEIIELTRNKLPLILTGLIEDWFIFGKDDNIDQNKLTENILNENTKILNSVFSISKKYEINQHKIKGKSKKSNLIQENQIRHFMCILKGSISIYLFNPEQKIESKINNFGKKESKYSFWNEQKEKLKDTNFIEINLSSEQIIFIPYKWWYCYKIREDSLILDIINDNIFTKPLKKLL
jgi:hypothetical protein